MILSWYDVSFYLEGLHAVLESTTSWVRMKWCIFSSSELQSIFIAAKHLRTLSFYNCNLNVTEEFSIADEKFDIKYLWLWDWGGDSGWANNTDALETLARAIANSSLKQSLKEIQIRERLENINEYIGYEDIVKQIFERYDLQDIFVLIK